MLVLKLESKWSLIVPIQERVYWVGLIQGVYPDPKQEFSYYATLVGSWDHEEAAKYQSNKQTADTWSEQPCGKQPKEAHEGNEKLVSKKRADWYEAGKDDHGSTLALDSDPMNQKHNMSHHGPTGLRWWESGYSEVGAALWGLHAWLQGPQLWIKMQVRAS